MRPDDNGAEGGGTVQKVGVIRDCGGTKQRRTREMPHMSISQWSHNNHSHSNQVTQVAQVIQAV